jgi:hypothetical protein
MGSITTNATFRKTALCLAKNSSSASRGSNLGWTLKIETQGVEKTYRI